MVKRSLICSDVNNLTSTCIQVCIGSDTAYNINHRTHESFKERGKTTRTLGKPFLYMIKYKYIKDNSPLFSISFDEFNLREGMELNSR